jgi:hypothetical protein
LSIEAKVFGFGSHFNQGANSRDIDLLVVHENIGESSCRLAIECRQELIRMVSKAHVSLLSKSEERQLDFVAASKAKYLGSIKENSIFSDIKILCGEFGLAETTTKPGGLKFEVQHAVSAFPC